MIQRNACLSFSVPAASKKLLMLEVLSKVRCCFFCFFAAAADAVVVVIVVRIIIAIILITTITVRSAQAWSYVKSLVFAAGTPLNSNSKPQTVQAPN